MVAEPPLVLCLDEDWRTLQIVARALATLPVRCLTTDTPAEAIRLAGHNRPALLILNLVMPGLTGWEVLERIRSCVAPQALLVLVLSANDNRVERLLAKNVARVDLFMPQPFDPAKLTQQVGQILRLPGWHSHYLPSADGDGVNGATDA